MVGLTNAWEGQKLSGGFVQSISCWTCLVLMYCTRNIFCTCFRAVYCANNIILDTFWAHILCRQHTSNMLPEDFYSVNTILHMFRVGQLSRWTYFGLAYSTQHYNIYYFVWCGMLLRSNHFHPGILFKPQRLIECYSLALFACLKASVHTHYVVCFPKSGFTCNTVLCVVPKKLFMRNMIRARYKANSRRSVACCIRKTQVQRS